MVATLARLRFAMMRNSLKREVWRIVVLLIGLLYGLSVLGLVVAGLVALGVAADPQLRLTLITLFGSVVMIGWVIVPIVAFGIDDTLDPQRFALFTTPTPRFAFGLVVAGAVSIPGIITVLIGLATGAAWLGAGNLFERLGGAVIAGVMGLVGAGMCLLFARAGTTAASGLMRNRRVRDLIGILVFALVMVLAFTPSLLQTMDLRWNADTFAGLARVMAWTPFGAPWAVANDVLTGAWLPLLGRLAIIAATVALVGWAYVRALNVAMTTVSSGSGPSARRTTRLPFTHTLLARFGERGLFGLRVTPGMAAVAGRSVRYWRSDPRYLVSIGGLAMIPIMLIVMGFVVSTQGGAPTSVTFSIVALFIGPAFGWIAGWSLHADISYDSTAFWLHVTTGVRGRDDLFGRILAYGVWQVPVVLVLAIVPPVLLDRAAYVPAVLGGSLAMLLVGYGVSSVVMVRVPYPVPPPGANPMSTKGGGATASMLAQFASMLVTAVIMIPTALTVIPVVAVGAAWGWLTLVVGLATGVTVLALGLRQGDSLYQRRAVDVLTTIKSWPIS